MKDLKLTFSKVVQSEDDAKEELRFECNELKHPEGGGAWSGTKFVADEDCENWKFSTGSWTSISYDCQGLWIRIDFYGRKDNLILQEVIKRIKAQDFEFMVEKVLQPIYNKYLSFIIHYSKARSYDEGWNNHIDTIRRSMEKR